MTIHSARPALILLQPASIERLLYALRMYFQSKDNALEWLRNQRGMAVTDWFQELPAEELDLLGYANKVKMMAPNELLSMWMYDTQHLATLRDQYREELKRQGEHHPRYPTLRAWLEAERESWVKTTRENGVWSSLCTNIEPGYFSYDRLCDLVPEQDVKLLMVSTSPDASSCARVVQVFFDEPGTLDDVNQRVNKAQSEADPLKIDADETPEVTPNETVELRLDGKLAAALRAIADYQKVPFERFIGQIFQDGLGHLSVSE